MRGFLTKPFMRSPGPLVKWKPDASTVLWLPGQDDAYSSTIRDRSGDHPVFTDSEQTIAEALDSSETVVDVSGGEGGFVNSLIRVDNEQMHVTGFGVGNITVIRGFNNTSAVEHDDATAIYKATSFAPNNGTITGATWVRNSQGLWVLSFDGTDDQVVWGDNKTLEFATGSFAFDFWIMRESDWANYPRVIGKRDASGYGYAINTLAGALGLYVGIRGANDAGSTDMTAYRPTIVDGVYTHLVYGFARVGTTLTLTTYQNGNPLGAEVATIDGSLANADIFAVWRTFCSAVTQVPLIRAYTSGYSISRLVSHFDQERHLFGV